MILNHPITIASSQNLCSSIWSVKGNRTDPSEHQIESSASAFPAACRGVSEQKTEGLFPIKDRRFSAARCGELQSVKQKPCGLLKAIRSRCMAQAIPCGSPRKVGSPAAGIFIPIHHFDSLRRSFFETRFLGLVPTILLRSSLPTSLLFRRL